MEKPEGPLVAPRLERRRHPRCVWHAWCAASCRGTAWRFHLWLPRKRIASGLKRCWPSWQSPARLPAK